MTKSLADRMGRYCVLHGMAKEDDREVLAYLLFGIIATAQQLLALAVVAIALSAIPQTIVFTLFFAALKRHAGGAHANKHWSCLTIFTGLTVAVCLLCKLVVLPPFVAVIASVIMLTLVLIKAPVIHPNNPKSQKTQKKMRNASIFIAVIQCAFIVIGILFWPVIALAGAFGGLGAAIALVLPMPAEESVE